MTTATKNPDMKLAIPVSLEDHLFVENVCTNGGYTFETFFAHCLNLYRKSLNEPLGEKPAPTKAIKDEIENRKSSVKKK